MMTQPEFIFNCNKCSAIKSMDQKGNWVYAYPAKKYMCIIAHDCRSNCIQKYNLKFTEEKTALVLQDIEYLDDKEFGKLILEFDKQENGERA